jgi:hypothetical protein
MDGLTMKAALAIGAVLLILFLWLIWKFFSKLFKHVIIMLLIGAVGATYYYCRSLPPPPPSYVGKHAYMDEVYIGVVENQAEDRQRGPVWIIRPIGGGPPMKYAKRRVTLKDKMELKPEQTTAPSPESKPASDKTEKKAEKKKS